MLRKTFRATEPLVVIPQTTISYCRYYRISTNSVNRGKKTEITYFYSIALQNEGGSVFVFCSTAGVEQGAWKT